MLEHLSRVSDAAIFKLIFSVRLLTSLYAVIVDCDETYNYWEPLHFLLFGEGFQTWEYSPAYAIRSWLYVYLHTVPAILVYPHLITSKAALFFVIRFTLALFSLCAEYHLFKALSVRFDRQLGVLFAVFSIFSTAMFNASAAFLPSSFSMVMNSLALGCYFRERWFLGVLCTAIGALVGWPFAALLGLPLVVEMLAGGRRLAARFLLYALVSAVLVGVPLVVVDSYMYGKLVLAPLNIVLYNVLSGRGPDLYGVEPPLFYVKNLVLNLNLAYPLSVLALPLAAVAGSQLWPRGKEKMRENSFEMEQTDKKLENPKKTHNRRKPSPKRKAVISKEEEVEPATSSYDSIGSLPAVTTYDQEPHQLRAIALVYVSALLWLVVFFSQPHKLLVLAAWSTRALYRLVVPAKLTRPFLATTLALFVALSAARVAALHRNFGGLLALHKDLNDQLLLSLAKGENSNLGTDQKTMVRLCLGKDWYRFHSSFFLPAGVEARFLRSRYRGLLPGHFPTSGELPNATRLVPTAQNDENREESDRYVPVQSCDFLMDLERSDHTTDDEWEPNYAKMPDFESVARRPFLLAERSHPLARAFYLCPFPSQLPSFLRLEFGTMHLLRRRRPAMNK